MPPDDLPLRADFDAVARDVRRRTWERAAALRESLVLLRGYCTRRDDREAVADALDSLRGVFAALRDVGTEDPRAASDPDGSRTVVTLGDVLPE